jgi:hypothetical protein
MKTFEKEIRLHINGADFVWLVMFAWLALDKHPAWWLAFAVTIAGWFVDPKYRSLKIFEWKGKP